jgi:hypothetical protein
MRRLYNKPADVRCPHRRVLLLFAAHYLSDAALARLWVKRIAEPVPVEFEVEDDKEPLPIPEDIVGDWFWGVWSRVLDAVEQDQAGQGAATFEHLPRR